MIRTAVGRWPWVMICLLCLTSWGLAHPVPKSEYDRNITVDVRPKSLIVNYRLEIDQDTLLKLVGNPENGFPLDPKAQITPKRLGDAFCDRMSVVIPDHFLATIGTQKLPWEKVFARVEFKDSVQFHFRFKTAINLQYDRAQGIEVIDLNFIDKKGLLIMKWDIDTDVEAKKVVEPPEKRVLGEGDEKNRLFLEARTLIAEPTPRKEDPPEPPPLPETTKGFWATVREVERTENLTLLLDSAYGIWAICLIAAIHGALHSISPGHGKTMVAAYLVGEQGRPRDAITLGIIVTITHTSAAFGIALALKFLFPDTARTSVQAVLGIVGGLSIVLVGVWLLVQRSRGKNDHIHFGGHSHSHSHSHSHAETNHPHSIGGAQATGNAHAHSHSHGLTPSAFRRLSFWRLLILGMAGGIIPCWGAILWVMYCVAGGRYGLALWTVLSFSIGLALVLIAIGLGVVWGQRAVTKPRAWLAQWRPLIDSIPILGAITVILIGLWLCKKSVGYF